MGCRVPISLFACMTEIKAVSGRIAERTASGLTIPSRPAGNISDRNATRFESAAGVQNGIMFDGGGDHVQGRTDRIFSAYAAHDPRRQESRRYRPRFRRW